MRNMPSRMLRFIVIINRPGCIVYQVKAVFLITHVHSNASAKFRFILFLTERCKYVSSVNLLHLERVNRIE